MEIDIVDYNFMNIIHLMLDVTSTKTTRIELQKITLTFVLTCSITNLLRRNILKSF